MSDSAFSDDWKMDTFERIKADHARRGIPYHTSGEERDRRAKEAHHGIQPKDIVVGVSDATTLNVGIADMGIE